MNGNFPTKSTFLNLTKRSPSIAVPLIRHIWKTKIPKKVKFFLWSLTYRSLNTHEKLQKKFQYTMLSPSMLLQRRGNLGPFIFALSLLRKLGILCLEFFIWSFVFVVRLIAGWLKGSTLEPIGRKETSYGDVLLGLFCGAFGKKGIVEFLKIAIILLILFGLCCNTTSWWSTNYTKHFCNYNLSMIFNNWKAIIFWFLLGSLVPCS